MVKIFNMVSQFNVVGDVKFFGLLQEQITPGYMIALTGQTTPKTCSFIVNLLLNNDSLNPDVALLLTPCFERKTITRNARANKQWHQEEIAADARFNLNRNAPFNIDILACNDQFMIAVNGTHFCQYGYRMPPEGVTAIQVSGDVELIGVELIEVFGYPDMRLHRPSITASLGRVIEDNALENPTVCALPQGLTPNHLLHIHGHVRRCPITFTLNLQQGSLLWPKPAIAFQFKQTFNLKTDDPSLTMNSWLFETWGDEKKIKKLVFWPGSVFYLVISAENDKYSVHVNGKLVSMFNYRIRPEIVDAVYIEGDVSIRHIIVSDN